MLVENRMNVLNDNRYDLPRSFQTSSMCKLQTSVLRQFDTFYIARHFETMFCVLHKTYISIML